MPRRRIALAAVLALALAGCSGTPAPAPEPTETAATAADATPTDAAPVELPDTAVGDAARWVLDLLAADSGPTAEEAQARFGEEFLSQVPADQVVQVFDQLRREGPFTVVSWDGTETQGTAELDSPGTPVLMMLALKDDRIDGLMFVPNEKAPEVDAPADAARALAGAAERSSFLLAEVTRNAGVPECTPIEERDADTVLPIGSMFKLYVLGAVVTAVEDGRLTWDQELTITDAVRSLPSGDLRNEPDGTKVTVEEAALKMISNSDNTAADLLIGAVGREAVEEELEAMGHHAPELNRPFLTTREAFQMAADAGLRAKFADASEGFDDATAEASDAQRAVLEGLPEWDLGYDEQTLADPAWDEGLDWYATARDLCAAQVALQQRAGTEAGQPVRGIMAAYPGIEVPGAVYIGFKGGSAPGELGLSFYVEGPEKIRVLVLQSAGSAADAVPQPNWLAGLAENTLD
ncbi:serine hydrolase [Tessaracoccus lubricantis]|uniref:Serine hydrolase n=1 Tax=Tessaracoccus lubricantis TaxID=545543 RepID=A0ABP9FMF9_9ACTN